jgi:putative phage-type endonuclease
MSFGNISLMVIKTLEILNQVIDKKTNINYEKMSSLKKLVYLELHKEFSEITYQIIDEIFIRIFNHKFIFNNNISFDSGQNCFREFENNYPDIKVPIKYKKLNEHFDKLKNLPQPAQRSQEWYDYRYNRITASDMAAAIDLNPYEPVESFILKKCDPNFPFRDNATVFHGKKYEPTATMIYEHIYNTRVFEFGALPSEKYTFLGASPDGICSKYTLDNKFSERLGTMLEIKCPVTREIVTSGKIAGDICPFYYYCQVQQQLICCELDVCDFWQCKIIEYPNKEAYLLDDVKSTINTVGISGTKINIDDRLKKGIILEFYPRNFEPEFLGDLPEWKSKYIIPKRLDMDTSQYLNWVVEMMDKYKELYPEIHKDYYFYRIIYWKLESSHNVEIIRDDKFFSDILPILKETWNKILYWRNHQKNLDELKSIVDKRKKYIKMNTKYTIHNDIIIKNKLNFLSQDFDIKTLVKEKVKTKYYKKPDVESDYNSEECNFIDEKKPNNKIINNEQNNKAIKYTNFTKTSGSTIIPADKSKANKSTYNLDDLEDSCDFID